MPICDLDTGVIPRYCMSDASPNGDVLLVNHWNQLQSSRGMFQLSLNGQQKTSDRACDEMSNSMGLLHCGSFFTHAFLKLLRNSGTTVVQSCQEHAKNTGSMVDRLRQFYSDSRSSRFNTRLTGPSCQTAVVSQHTRGTATPTWISCACFQHEELVGQAVGVGLVQTLGPAWINVDPMWIQCGGGLQFSVAALFLNIMNIGGISLNERISSDSSPCAKVRLC